MLKACIRTIDPSHTSITGAIAFLPFHFHTSVTKANRKYATEAVVSSVVKKEVTGKGQDPFGGGEQQVHKHKKEVHHFWKVKGSLWHPGTQYPPCTSAGKFGCHRETTA
ncbi:hypothetical protein WMY93_019131 [Mugilogobius chulae]|uniref:Uncharacterized protein n=1 Tax=Mugilogobius chulae TaxID=88201 RepID=A0AAW0NG92_9GOBI